MTINQLSVCLENITVRKHNEYAAQAALHGHKVPTKNRVPKKIKEIDPVKKAAISRAIQEELKRKVKRNGG